MNFLDILFISISLAMDAFSISLSKGLSMTYKYKRNFFLISLSFSIFQMLMPILGYYLGSIFNKYLINLSHLIAFIILAIIGLNMIKESNNKNNINIGLSLKELLGLSIATSIDAFAVGITFNILNINLFLSIITIGIITFILSYIGLIIGRYLGIKLFNNSLIFGGIMLIIISIKFLLEHLKII